MYRRTLAQWRGRQPLALLPALPVPVSPRSGADEAPVSTESVQQCLQRIKERDGQLGSFITVDEQGALKQARTCDHKTNQGHSHCG